MTAEEACAAALLLLQRNSYAGMVEARLLLAEAVAQMDAAARALGHESCATLISDSDDALRRVRSM